MHTDGEPIVQQIELTSKGTETVRENTMAADDANSDTEHSTLISSLQQTPIQQSAGLTATPASATRNDESPLSRIRLYFQRLAYVYSFRYLLFLGLTQFLICGVFAGLIGACFLPVFQRLGVDAATEQVLVLVCTLPYTASPLLGVISDLVPLGGYHKKYWMVVAIAVGAFGSASLVTSTSSIAIVVLSLVAMNLELSVLNLLNEGKYSEIMRDHPESGADIITFNQACSALGSLVAMSFVGPLSDSGNLKALFTIASVLCLAPLVPVLLGWLPELRRSPGENGLRSGCSCSCIMVDYDRLVKQKHTVRIALLVGVGGPLMAVVSAYVSRSIGIFVSTILLLVVLALSYHTLPRVIASVVAYTIVTRASTPNIRSALQYFYTANETCLPGGPHFSYTYYITYNGIVGEVFMLTAVLFYQSYMSSWSYRSVLWTTLVLACSGRLVDLVLVMRWNLAVGVPDKVFFLLGSSMLESMTSMLHLLPFKSIVGKVCPPGTETATFAFVAGVSSFASTFSSLAGAALMDAAGLKTVSPSCDFSSLPLLIVGLSIVMPIVMGIPAIFWLIPDALQTEPLVRHEYLLGADEDDDVTQTSDPMDEDSIREDNDSLSIGMPQATQLC